MKILSIDDSKAVHAYIDSCLLPLGVAMSHAFDGLEGLKAIEATTYDLILLDWEMPKMNGPQVLAEMIKRGVQTPIVMLTSKNNVDDITKMLEIGAKEYILKPFTPDILVEKINGVSGASLSHAVK